jgi:hypothetical protein
VQLLACASGLLAVVNENEIPMQEHSEAYSYLFSIGVAVMAQAAMALNRKAKGEPFSMLEFVSSLVAAGVMGLCICMACHACGLGYEWGGALAGLGGMLGKDAVVEIVLPALKKYMGIQ